MAKTKKESFKVTKDDLLYLAKIIKYPNLDEVIDKEDEEKSKLFKEAITHLSENSPEFSAFGLGVTFAFSAIELFCTLDKKELPLNERKSIFDKRNELLALVHIGLTEKDIARLESKSHDIDAILDVLKKVIDYLEEDED